MNRVANYFNIAKAEPQAAPTKKQGLPVLVQYVALLLGIVVQPFFARFQETGSWSLELTWGWILFAVIVGLVVFPAVYRRSFGADKPAFVQFCVTFAGGMGWESLLSTGAKAAGL